MAWRLLLTRAGPVIGAELAERVPFSFKSELKERTL